MLNSLHRLFRRQRRNVSIRAARLTLDQITAQAINAAGFCAYDKYPCHSEPTHWVKWQDGKQSGEAGYCSAHATCIIIARATTYAAPNFPESVR